MRKAVIFAAAVVCGATSGRSYAQSLQPPDWQKHIALAEIRDTNPDPRIVEVNMEARVESLEIAPGVRTEVWTYNGALPGPLIRVNVGDRLIVHFTNMLPKATTIHWHGVRVPIEMDGVPDISQPEVKPGESFTYDFLVPDAGLYWYHPHVLSAAEVGFGLYGALLVEDPKDSIKVADELVMVLSDIGIDAKTGRIDDPDSGGSLGTLFGREGNFTLVNGRPFGSGATVAFHDGALQRWRIVNAAKSRYFDLVLGDGQPFMLTGVDGGPLEYSVQSSHLVLGPGERADVLVAPRAEKGQPIVLRTFPFDRGFGSTEFRTVDDLLTFVPSAQPSIAAAPLPKTTASIQPMSAAGATPIKLELNVNMSLGRFDIAGGPFWKASQVRAALGETQVWTMVNNAPWAHPMHIHGFFFQVLDEQGKPVHPYGWKDTVSVPANSTVRILVKFDRQGSWMYHCHILDHADAGLMSTVDVGEVTSEMPMEHHHSSGP